MNVFKIALNVNAIALNLGHAFSVPQEEAQGVALETWWAKAHLNYIEPVPGDFPGPMASWWISGGAVGTATATGRLVVEARERLSYDEESQSCIHDWFIRLEAWAGPAPLLGRPEPAMALGLTFRLDEGGKFSLERRDASPGLFLKRQDRLALLFECTMEAPGLRGAVEELDPADDIRRIYEHFRSSREAYRKTWERDKVKSTIVSFPEMEVSSDASIEPAVAW